MWSHSYLWVSPPWKLVVSVISRQHSESLPLVPFIGFLQFGNSCLSDLGILLTWDHWWYFLLLLYHYNVNFGWKLLIFFYVFPLFTTFSFLLRISFVIQFFYLVFYFFYHVLNLCVSFLACSILFLTHEYNIISDLWILMIFFFFWKFYSCVVHCLVFLKVVFIYLFFSLICQFWTSPYADLGGLFLESSQDLKVLFLGLVSISREWSSIFIYGKSGSDFHHSGWLMEEEE